MARKGLSSAALTKFEAEFGKAFGGSALRRNRTTGKYQVVSSGSIALDYALGVGGYVQGRITEIWGPDSVGKSTLSLIAIGQAQATYPDRMTCFIDVEGKLDREWATKLGVDLGRMYHVVPESAEDVADIVKAMITGGMVSFVVLDSVGAMVNAEEKDKDADERSVGTTPQIITRMVKIAANELARHDCQLFVVNQVRANLAYGADTTRPGGFALAHSTTHRLKVRKAAGLTSTLKIGSGDDSVQVGFKIAVKVEKNQVASPQRTAIITIINQPSEKYGADVGISDRSGEAFDVGKKTGVIRRSGAKYTLPDGAEVKSEEACRALLAERPDLVEEIRTQVLLIISGNQAIIEGEHPDAEEEPDARDPDHELKLIDPSELEPVVDLSAI
jgi:recombination protein RecA